VRFTGTTFRLAARSGRSGDLNALARARVQQRDVVDLTSSNPTAVELPTNDRAVAQVLAEASVACYQPEPLGIASARQVIAAQYEAARGRPVRPEDIVLTASTSESYSLLFKLLCDPGEAVATGHPGYPLFEPLSRLEGVHLLSFDMDYDGLWHVQLASLRAALSDLRVRAVILVSPGNPTGCFVGHDELDAVARLCAEAGVALIVDEVFAGYPIDPQRPAPLSVGRSFDCPVFVLDGLSKSCALPQLKLGWIWLGGPGEMRAEIREALGSLADNYLSVNQPTALALPRLLQLGEQRRRLVRERVKRNRRHLRSTLAGTVASVLGAEAGWSALVHLPALHSDEGWALDLINEAGVLVQPGYFYDMPERAPKPLLVISLLPEPHTFDEGLRRLKNRLVATT